MLTDKEIKKIVKNKRVTIEPYDENLIGPSSYDLRLGPVLLKPKDGVVVDLRSEEKRPEYDRIEIPDEGYVLGPNEFVLGQTLEFIGTDSDVGCIIDGRSTIARLGLTVHQTAMVINPGVASHIITLEIFNASQFYVVLFKEMPIAKLMFFDLNGKNDIPYKEIGKYSGQSETTGAKYSNGSGSSGE